MNWLDIVIIVLLVVQVLIGLWQGLIRAVLSLVGMVVGVLLASHFYPQVASILGFVHNDNLANVLAFILILVLVLIVVGIIAMLVHKAAHLLMLGLFDSIGGAVLGLISGYVFLSALLAVWVKFYGGSSGAIADSMLARLMLDNFPVILGLLPGGFGQDIRNFFQ